jgi:hypothetical protein
LPRWLSCEADLPEENDQDDDEDNQTADADIHDFTPNLLFGVTTPPGPLGCSSCRPIGSR